MDRTVTHRPPLSKSRIFAGAQYHLRAWLETHRRDLAPAPDACADAATATLDRGYVHDGKRLDLDALFALHPVFDEAMARIHTVDALVRETHEMLAHHNAPRIAPGPHCFTPHPCPYHAHCTRGHVRSEHPIDELPRLGARRRAALEAAGIADLRAIPDDFPLTALQRIVRRSVRERRPVVHGDIAAAIAAMPPPVRHLDFETFAPAIPRITGTRSFDAIPFLVSVHTERDDAPPAHTDYLHETPDDPCTPLAERLLDAVGTICTWSGYERTVLRALTDALPHRAEALRTVEARLIDLLAVVRGTVYHPGFRSSFSLKRVAPALVPGTQARSAPASLTTTARISHRVCTGTSTRWTLSCISSAPTPPSPDHDQRAQRRRHA